ncbi:MAG: hypothetical protein ACLRMX_03425 [Lachnospira eligens]
MAMYEDFYDDIPKMNISVYGVPKSLFKKKFGKTFGANEFLKYKDTLKKNDYKDCDLLCSKDITETGVYYVDYAQLNKKGDYINYIIEYKFSDAGEKVYLKACAAGGYKINNEKVYSEWKKAHAEQMINNRQTAQYTGEDMRWYNKLRLVFRIYSRRMFVTLLFGMCFVSFFMIDRCLPDILEADMR